MVIKEELVTGLNNALARGESLEKAIRSLIAGGYNTQDVYDAADSINMGAIGEVSKQTIKDQPIQSIRPAVEIKPQYKALPVVS